jgi:hypothetical protein
MAEKKLKDRIYRVGVELEGGWEQLPPGLTSKHIVADSSVQIPSRVDPNTLQSRIHVGEIPSPKDGLPMADYANWMRIHYPQHVNETCGLHTHVSFRYRLHYMLLMNPDFTPFVIKGIINWAENEKLPKDHPIWKRIMQKDHNHCAHIYLGDNQVKAERKEYSSRGTPNSRYTALNYRYAQCIANGGTRGTIECRLLPMMETVDQAISAVGEVFKLTNQFLAQLKVKEPRVEAKVALAPPLHASF